MITNFIFLVFIVYLIYIYNNLQSSKYLNIETYLENASVIIERLEKENDILKDENNEISNKLIKNDMELDNLNQNINSKTTEIDKLNKNFLEEKKTNQNFSNIFEESEKNLYQQISDLKLTLKQKVEDLEEFKKENIILKNKEDILYKFLKLSDYALYEELLKRI